MRKLDENWFNNYRRETLAGKRRMNGDAHRDWDSQLFAMLGDNPDAVATVTMAGHTSLRVDPTSESRSMGVLINLDKVRILGFARGELLDGSNIWLLDAATSFYFPGGLVKALPRHMPEYSAQPRQSASESRFGTPGGEEVVPVWSAPIILNHNADILGEK